jgi:hypothetical protein
MLLSLNCCFCRIYIVEIKPSLVADFMHGQGRLGSLRESIMVWIENVYYEVLPFLFGMALCPLSCFCLLLQIHQIIYSNSPPLTLLLTWSVLPYLASLVSSFQDQFLYEGWEWTQLT